MDMLSRRRMMMLKKQGGGITNPPLGVSICRYHDNIYDFITEEDWDSAWNDEVLGIAINNGSRKFMYSYVDIDFPAKANFETGTDGYPTKEDAAADFDVSKTDVWVNASISNHAKSIADYTWLDSYKGGYMFTAGYLNIVYSFLGRGRCSSLYTKIGYNISGAYFMCSNTLVDASLYNLWKVELTSSKGLEQAPNFRNGGSIVGCFALRVFE